MNKKLLSAVIWVVTTLGAITDASARPEYVAPTGAAGCTDCHVSEFGGPPWKPGVLGAFAAGGIAGLAVFIQSLSPVAADTKPVLHPINPQWDVTVGEIPLLIPLRVSDAENDTFSVRGSAPMTGYSFSAVRIDSQSNLPTIDFEWAPIATQANKNYKLSVYAQETGAGRTLSSNTVTTNIHVWPARVSATKNVSQFMMQGAQWRNNKLIITGQVIFKPTVTAANRATALNTLRMSVRSNSGFVIGLPLKLTPNANGKWTKTLTLTGTEVPCLVKLKYEGLNAARTVKLAPPTCVQ